MFATGETVGLAKWIIIDTHVFYPSFYCKQNINTHFQITALDCCHTKTQGSMLERDQQRINFTTHCRKGTISVMFTLMLKICL